MKVGDLVRHTGNFPDGKTEDQKKVGIVVADKTMICAIDVDSPYRMGSVIVMWDGKLRREVLADLEIINETG